jgi:hypothetical protein
MKKVDKARFKHLYFQYGGGTITGWTADYWEKFFECELRAGARFLAEVPESPQHTRMMVIADHAANQYRLFFMTEEEEGDLLDFPDTE